MAIKHLKPKTKEEIAFAKANMPKEERIQEFISKYFWNSSMEIYLPKEEQEKLYDLVVDKKYKIKVVTYRIEGFYDQLVSIDRQKYEELVEPLIDKGWIEFWSDLDGDRETILIKPPIVKENNTNEMIVKEDAMGGVSAPMSTLSNTPGMGNVTPAGIGKIGSGDNFGKSVGKKLYTQGAKSKTKRKKKKLEEENINPYDKIGTMMAKKAKVPMTFNKKKSKKNQNAMVQKKFEHQIISFDEFKNAVNETGDAKQESEFTAEQKKKIRDFVEKYKGDFEDTDLHDFVEKELKLDVHEVEEYIYSLSRTHLREMNESKKSNKKGHHINIENETLKNDNFRKVLYTAKNMQLVLMSLKPGEDIGEEVHSNIDQFFRFEAGNGKVIINDNEYKVSDGDTVIIPQGSKHNIINTGSKELKIYTIYTPPNHKDQIVFATKEEASKSKEKFDGKTTE